MTKHVLPAGCHDAESAAQLLGMSKKALLKKMREMGWLNVGGGPGNHNMPRRELIAHGYLFTQERGYCLKGKREIAKTYSVMLLSQTGFMALKKHLDDEKLQRIAPPVPEKKAEASTPPKAPAVTQSEPETIVPFNRETADAARAKTLDHINRLLAS